MTGLRLRLTGLPPSCGHKKLVDCPLTQADWRVVLYAYAAFLETCRRVSQEAHRREA